jgi:hypothetical protein
MSTTTTTTTTTTKGKKKKRKLEQSNFQDRPRPTDRPTDRPTEYISSMSMMSRKNSPPQKKTKRLHRREKGTAAERYREREAGTAIAPSPHFH